MSEQELGMKYGYAIKMLRVAREMPQAELAEAVGVTKSHISLVEAGKRQPSIGLCERICQELGLPMSLLMTIAGGPSRLSAETSENLAALGLQLLGLLSGAEANGQ